MLLRLICIELQGVTIQNIVIFLTTSILKTLNTLDCYGGKNFENSKFQCLLMA
jgi:hypothetical protein